MKSVVAVAVLGLLAAPAFADDVNVRTRTLPNETTYVAPTVVDVVCVVDDSALLKDCKLADNTKAPDPAVVAAIKNIDGRSHVAGHYTVGETMRLKLALDSGHRSTPWQLIR